MFLFLFVDVRLTMRYVHAVETSKRGAVVTLAHLGLFAGEVSRKGAKKQSATAFLKRSLRLCVKYFLSFEVA